MRNSRHANARFGGFGALLLAGALGVAACVWVSRAAAGPLAGTSIPNTATGSGQFSPSGAPFSLGSNTVVAVVQPLEALALVDPRGATVAPGLSLAFAHRLTNLGNATCDFRLGLPDAANAGFDAAGLTLVRDVDGDGAIGAGDVTLAPGASVTLAPGAFVDLLVAGAVPMATPAAAQARITLTATGLAQGATAANVDTVTTPTLAAEPVLEYFTGPDYLVRTRIGHVGTPLYAQAIAPGWNARPGVVDSAAVTF